MLDVNIVTKGSRKGKTTFRFSLDTTPNRESKVSARLSQRETNRKRRRKAKQQQQQ